MGENYASSIDQKTGKKSTTALKLIIWLVVQGNRILQESVEAVF